MGTDKVSVANLRLVDLLKQHREAAEQQDQARQGKMTMGEALQVVLERIQGNPERKPSTKANTEERICALKRSWPGLERKDVREVKKADCLAWVARCGVKLSATRFNQLLRSLRWAFEVGIEYGNIFTNPAKAIEWRREFPKRLRLPEPEDFIRLVASIRNNGWIDAEESARFVVFLAYTGCRKTEALNVRWQDTDFERGKLKVLGDSVTGTKNREARDVPLIPDARRLLEQIRAERRHEAPSALVIRHRDSRKALANACKRIGIPPLTHHDLRHLFATRCIEAGVDIPTGSRWLGHKDGGALAMRVYGHLRDEHSVSMAQRVSFNQAVPSNVVKLSKEALI